MSRMRKWFAVLLVMLIFSVKVWAASFQESDFGNQDDWDTVNNGGNVGISSGFLIIEIGNGDIDANVFTPTYVYQDDISGAFDVYTKMILPTDPGLDALYQQAGIVFFNSLTEDVVTVGVEYLYADYNALVVKHIIDDTLYYTKSAIDDDTSTVWLRLKRNSSGKFQAFYTDSAPSTWSDWVPLANPGTMLTDTNNGRVGLFGCDAGAAGTKTVQFDLLHGETWTQNINPVSVNYTNPLWFDDPSGNPLYLAGHATRNVLQDYNIYHNHTLEWDASSPMYVTGDMSWSGYKADLATWGINYIRLWTTMSAGWGEDYDWITEPDPDYEQSPTAVPYARIGVSDAAGNAGRQVDLNVFDQAYFDRMREKIVDLSDETRPVYVSLLLFDAWNFFYSDTLFDKLGRSLYGNVFRSGNNDNSQSFTSSTCGAEFFFNPSRHETKWQKAFIQKVIATTYDLNNVIYEITNELGADQYGDLTFQNNVHDWIDEYVSAAGYPTHLIHMSPGGFPEYCWPWDGDSMAPEDLDDNADVLSNASKNNCQNNWWDTTSEIYTNPKENKTDLYTGYTLRPIVNDSDHFMAASQDSYPSSPIISLIRGYHYNIQDEPYDCNEIVNFPTSVLYPACETNSTGWNNARYAAGRAVWFTEQFANLVNMVPQAQGVVETPSSHAAPSSTGYCLYDNTGEGADYLVYQPNDADIKVYLADGAYKYHWYNVDTATYSKNSGTLNICDNGYLQEFTEESQNRPDDDKIVLYIERTGDATSCNGGTG